MLLLNALFVAYLVCLHFNAISMCVVLVFAVRAGVGYGAGFLRPIAGLQSVDILRALMALALWYSLPR